MFIEEHLKEKEGLARVAQKQVHPQGSHRESDGIWDLSRSRGESGSLPLAIYQAGRRGRNHVCFLGARCSGKVQH